MVVLPGQMHLDINMTDFVSRLSFIKGSLLIGHVWQGATSRSPTRMSRMHVQAQGTINKMHVLVLGFAIVTCASANNLIEMPEWFFSVPMENLWSNLGVGLCTAPQGQWIICHDVYHPVLDSWLQLVETPDFLVRGPVSGETLNLSITCHADDVAKGKLFKYGEDLQHMVLVEEMAVSDSLQRVCTAQHTGKQEHIVSMRGRVSWADMQRIYTAFFF